MCKVRCATVVSDDLPHGAINLLGGRHNDSPNGQLQLLANLISISPTAAFAIAFQATDFFQATDLKINNRKGPVSLRR